MRLWLIGINAAVTAVKSTRSSISRCIANIIKFLRWVNEIGYSRQTPNRNFFWLHYISIPGSVVKLGYRIFLFEIQQKIIAVGVIKRNPQNLNIALLVITYRLGSTIIILADGISCIISVASISILCYDKAVKLVFLVARVTNKHRSLARKERAGGRIRAMQAPLTIAIFLNRQLAAIVTI